MVFNYVLLKQYNEFPSYKRKFRWWLYILGLIICYICIAILSPFIFIIHSALERSFLDSLKAVMCYVHSCLPFLLKQTAGSTCTCLESTKKKNQRETRKAPSLTLLYFQNSFFESILGKKQSVKSLNRNMKKKKSLSIYLKRHMFYFIICWNVITGVKHRMIMKWEQIPCTEETWKGKFNT